MFGRWKLVSEADFRPLTQETSKLVAIDVLDRVSFEADLSSGLFCILSLGDVSPETLSHCLHDLILPRLLSFDGVLVLHGGLCFGPSGAVGFIGPSGRGKSTLVAGLHGMGLHLMGDDAFVLDPGDSGYDARRVYPSLRLFPDSISRIVGDGRQTTPMADYSTKRRVPFDEGPAEAPLVALFRLTEPEPEIRITRLSMAASCVALVSNSFVLDVDDIAETRRKFGLASTAARQIAVYDLAYPRSYDRLPDIHAAILATLGWSPADLAAT